MNDGPEWFAPKSHGYGSGLPIAWQGWVVLIVYLAVVLGSIPLGWRSVVAHLSIVVVASAILCIICSKTTRGGWRWRWGDKE